MEKYLSTTPYKKVKNKLTIDKNSIKTLSNLVTSSVEFVQYGSSYYAIHKEMFDKVSFLSEKLRTLYAGIPLGSCKGKDFVPDAALAFSWELNRDNFSCIELTWQEAITFLRRENLFFNDAPKGVLLLLYNGIPLGWVKNVGNRCNNLYPQEWRIRMEADYNEYSQLIK